MKEKNRNYSYVVDHDIGYSPNPFFEYLTLAGCKPSINRKKGLRAYINQDWLEQGEVWIIGTAGKYLILEGYEFKNDRLQKLATGIGHRYKFIFAFQVKEFKCFNDYFHERAVNIMLIKIT